MNILLISPTPLSKSKNQSFDTREEELKKFPQTKERLKNFMKTIAENASCFHVVKLLNVIETLPRSSL